MSYIVHSMPTLPLHLLADFDQSHGISMHRRAESSGEGYMLVAPPDYSVPPTGVPSPVPDSMRTEWNQVVARLVEGFLSHVAALLPVVTREELEVEGVQSPQLLRYAMAAVAAARSDCPKEIFDALRHLIKKGLTEEGKCYSRAVFVCENSL